MQHFSTTHSHLPKNPQDGRPPGRCPTPALFRGPALVSRRSACHALLTRLQFGDLTTADDDNDDDDDDDEIMTIERASEREGKLSPSETATGNMRGSEDVKLIAVVNG